MVSLVKRPTEEWCAYRDQFGIWQKSATKESWNIPDRTQMRLFKTEEEVNRFLNKINGHPPTPQN